MSMDTMLVPIPSAEPNPVILETGIRAAKAANAHVVGMYVESPQQLAGRQPMPLYSASALQAQSFDLGDDVVADEGNALEEKMRARFEEMCAEHGVMFGGNETPEADGSTAAWRSERGDLMDVLNEQVPNFDVVVAAGGSVSRIEREIADHVLRYCERPVLLSSSKLNRDFDGTTALAWQPSDECWHAVTAAMPLMERSASVAVISVCDQKNRDEVSRSQEEIIDYLTQHGLKATSRVADRSVRKVPDAIMTEASEAGAGLIVMGAYSHSPFYEMIFGGVTRTVLSRAAATPVLMAH